MSIFKNDSVIVPPGVYWLGDPCYAIDDHDEWIALLEDANFFEDQITGQLKGFTVYSVGTLYGDGHYQDSEGFRYPVDAGMIGLVPVELTREDIEGMRKINIDKPTIFSVNTAGMITFGNVTIMTGDINEDEE